MTIPDVDRAEPPHPSDRAEEPPDEDTGLPWLADAGPASSRWCSSALSRGWCCSSCWSGAIHDPARLRGPARQHGRDRGLRRLADTRAAGVLSHYLKGDRTTGWLAIGISVMATQASAITFISTPGQGYQDGLGFVQNYFGAPLALIIIAAVFLPMYRRLKVYTAYEFLGPAVRRQDPAPGRGPFPPPARPAAGITIYAPAIILSTVLGWRPDATIVLSRAWSSSSTRRPGGSEAVNVTQKYQLGVIFCGMAGGLRRPAGQAAPGVTLRRRLGPGGRLRQAARGRLLARREPALHVLVGPAGRLLPGAVVLRHRSVPGAALPFGGSLRESRLGLMFNAVFKIPMQFFILLLGSLVFVFYQFEPPPVFFNRAAWEARARRDTGRAAARPRAAVRRGSTPRSGAPI